MIMSTERSACMCGEVRTSMMVVPTSGIGARLSFPVQLLGDPEILNERDVRGTHIGTASALETVHHVKLRFHFFVAGFARQHAEPRGVQVHGTHADAL